MEGQKMKKIYSITDIGYDIELFHLEDNVYMIKYGQQETIRSNYNDAAEELGHCIFHALVSEGKMPN